MCLLSNIDWNSFGSSISGALFGALSAFALNAIHEDNKNKNKNKNYMLYALTIIVSTLNRLYSFKKDYIAKEEVKKEIKTLETHILAGRELIKAGQPFCIEITNPFAHISKKVIDSGFDFPVDIESLNFISKYNPNLITLLFLYKKTINTLNILQNELYQYIDSVKGNYVKGQFSDFENWYSLLINIEKLIDDNINFSHLLLSCMSKILKNEYNTPFEIKMIEEYEPLKPVEIEGWDSLKKCEFKKKSFMNKLKDKKLKRKENWK